MVTLERIRVENFFNVTQADVPLKDQGLVLITGENGSGKSAIFTEGPYYGLYGESFRYGPKPGRDVIKRGARTFLCALDIHVEGIGNLTIARARKHKKFADGLSVWKGDEDLTRASDAATQAWLDEVYAMGAKTFINSVLFTKNTLQFPLLPDSKKKEILDDLLRLGALDVARKAGEEARKSLTGSITTLTNRIDLHKERIPELAAHLKKLEAENASWEDNHKEAVKTASVAVKTAEEWVKTVKSALEKARWALTRAQSTQSVLQTKITAARETLQAAREGFIRTQTALQSKISAARAAVGDWKAQIAGKEVLLGRPCPKCGQNVGQSVQEAVDHAKKEQGKAEKALKKLTDELEGMAGDEKTLNQANAAITKQSEELKSAQQEASSASQTHDRHVRALGEAEGAQLAASERLEAVKNERNHIKPQVDEAKERIQALDEKLVREKEQLKQAEKDYEDEKVLDACFGPKGARLLLLDMAIPSLNSEALRLCARMQTPMNVTFNVRGDEQSYAGTFEVSVDNPTGAESYKGDSDGERRRVDLVLLFSLLKLAGSRGAKSFNQAIFDEPFENLDVAGQEAVLSILRDEAKLKSSTFVITHSAFELASAAARIWRVQKGGEIEFD